MKIYNPELTDLEVQIKGVTYFIEGKGTLENVPEEHARYWQEFLHKFLVLRKDDIRKLEDAVSAPMAMLPTIEPKTTKTKTLKKEVSVSAALSSTSTDDVESTDERASSDEEVTKPESESADGSKGIANTAKDSTVAEK